MPLLWPCGLFLETNMALPVKPVCSSFCLKDFVCNRSYTHIIVICALWGCAFEAPNRGLGLWGPTHQELYRGVLLL